MAGIFISLEGPDGAGKTTQLELLAESLRRRGFTVLCTREPGGTALGDKIRSLLLDPRSGGMDARAEALLYMAARAQHVAEVIAPALARGEVVLCDRYADSTIVYQGAARRLAHAELAAINLFATGALMPELTVLLDADTSLLGGRRAGRGGADRIEDEGEAFQLLVRQGFRELAAAEPQRIRPVAADGTVEEVHRRVAKVVGEYLHRRSRGED